MLLPLIKTFQMEFTFSLAMEMLQVGSGEVFSITEDLSLLPDPNAVQCNSTKRDLDCVQGELSTDNLSSSQYSMM